MRSRVPKPHVLVVFVCFVFVVSLSTIRLVEHSTNWSSWLWAGTVSIGVFLITGPFAWHIRDRISANRYGKLRIIGFGLLFVVTLVLSVELPLRGLSQFLYATVLGGTLGYVTTVVVEQGVVSDHRQSMTGK